MRRAQMALVAVIFAAALLVGCGDDDSSPAITGTSRAPSTTAGATTTTTQTGTQANATFTVVSSTLGEIVADGSGRTLYVFANDEPNKSNCTGACLTTWPRYAPPRIEPSPSLDPALFATIDVDGVQQATISSRPLYYYAGDRAPGDVNGQGVGGNWFAVRPNGDNVS